ncbi:MAG: helix-turn-helix domain-containing protein [archaeon]|nr:helix-turn-helix domain-containing protein [archaeon]
MNCDKIGKFIATSRKKKGLTQIELADKLNITDRAISKWERGKGCPDISLLEDLSKILGVSIIELLKGEKIKKNKSLEKEELLYSMNYAKESTKMKMYKTISNVIVTLITVIFLTIVFNNLKISVFFNHRYYPNIMINDIEGTKIGEKLFPNIEKKIELIKIGKINYSTDELNQIITIIEKDLDEDQKLYHKD